MNQFLQLLFSGLAMGSIYGLVALGFVLIVKAVGILNFAQGELLMLGGFYALTLGSILHLPVPLVVVLLIVMAAATGYVVQLVSYYPLRRKPLLTVIIATIGVSIALQNLAQIVWGVDPRPLEPLVSTKPVQVGNVVILPYQLFVMGVTLLLVLLQGLFFGRTRLGRRMRATAQDMEAARLVGIPVRRMIAITFVLSSVLAALGGMLVGPLFYVTPQMGLPILLKAFAATVVGGFGSVPGAIVGGLFIGVAETLVAGYVSSVYKDVVAFGILILTLYVRPEGFFGEEVSERV